MENNIDRRVMRTKTLLIEQILYDNYNYSIKIINTMFINTISKMKKGRYI